MLSAVPLQEKLDHLGIVATIVGTPITTVMVGYGMDALLAAAVAFGPHAAARQEPLLTAFASARESLASGWGRPQRVRALQSWQESMLLPPQAECCAISIPAYCLCRKFLQLDRL